MNPAITREKILKTLEQVIDPESGKNVVQAGRIEGIVLKGAQVGFMLTTTAEAASRSEPLRKACEETVSNMTGVEKVTVVLTAEKAADSQPHHHSEPSPSTRQQAVWNKTPVPGIRHILLVASGKGGVGKSTVAVCLARAFAAKGKRVGLLDADIYGPSIPTMMGLSGEPEIRNNQMVPHMKDGIACMSMGFLLGDNAAVLRAPMITKALNQMLRQSAWGTEAEPLDVLVVDMPPGTGDVQLSMAQQTPVSGVVIVTTPQEVAVVDARKGIDAFRKMQIPVLGVLENMSVFIDPVSGNPTHLFGKGGGQRLAKQESTLFLGELPLDPSLGQALDQGLAPQLPAVFDEIALHLLAQLRHREVAA